MLPDNSHDQPVDPVTLPPVRTAAPEPTLQPPTSGAAPTPVPSAAAPAGTAQVIAQARQLVGQYQNDPYKLSLALQQLKTQYLAEQFHVNANPSQK